MAGMRCSSRADFTRQSKEGNNMATLATAKLEITLNLPQRRARVVVTGAVRFSQLEQFQMQHGLRFRLDCKIWGEDLGQGNWLDPDDFLFAYASKIFPDANP